MPKSILREPPAGSELAARLEVFRRACAVKAGDPAQFAHLDPGLRGFFELDAVLTEPRLWKLPAEWLARHHVPAYVEAAYGAEAAAELEGNLRLALVIAGLLQEADRLAAPARKRSREPQPDWWPTLSALVMAEYLNVADDLPNARPNARYMETARRLGGKRAKIDRAAVRRAVEGFIKATACLSDEHYKHATQTVFYLCERFRPGWKSAA